MYIYFYIYKTIQKNIIHGCLETDMLEKLSRKILWKKKLKEDIKYTCCE